ncbi:MAG: CopG family transcriptional regulator [Opitutales bacterium]
MATLTLRLPAKLSRDLAAASKQSKLTKSDLARDAIERQIRVWRFEQARARAVPRAQKMGIFTDEDVFRHLGIRTK